MAKPLMSHPPVLIVPHGGAPLQSIFINFLWEREITAFLTKNAWAGEAVSGNTAYGIGIFPGSA